MPVFLYVGHWWLQYPVITGLAECSGLQVEIFRNARALPMKDWVRHTRPRFLALSSNFLGVFLYQLSPPHAVDEDNIITALAQEARCFG